MEMGFAGSGAIDKNQVPGLSKEMTALYRSLIRGSLTGESVNLKPPRSSDTGKRADPIW